MIFAVLLIVIWLLFIMLALKLRAYVSALILVIVPIAVMAVMHKNSVENRKESQRKDRFNIEHLIKRASNEGYVIIGRNIVECIAIEDKYWRFEAKEPGSVKILVKGSVPEPQIYTVDIDDELNCKLTSKDTEIFNSSDMWEIFNNSYWRKTGFAYIEKDGRKYRYSTTDENGIESVNEIFEKLYGKTEECEVPDVSSMTKLVCGYTYTEGHNNASGEFVSDNTEDITCEVYISENGEIYSFLSYEDHWIKFTPDEDCPLMVEDLGGTINVQANHKGLCGSGLVFREVKNNNGEM